MMTQAGLHAQHDERLRALGVAEPGQERRGHEHVVDAHAEEHAAGETA